MYNNSYTKKEKQTYTQQEEGRTHKCIDIYIYICIHNYTGTQTHIHKKTQFDIDIYIYTHIQTKTEKHMQILSSRSQHTITQRKHTYLHSYIKK